MNESPDSGSALRIETARPGHAEALCAAVDSVARERRYLASTRGFSLEQTQAFIDNIRSGAGVQFVALRESGVVGWCDIVRRPYEGFEHCGVLGMGVIEAHRRRGTGSALLNRALVAAAKAGIRRIELEVLASNTAAIRMYERFGFVIEGRKHGARVLDGHSDDLICMALIR